MGKGKGKSSKAGKKATARKAVLATARRMSEAGLSLGRSGNVSCRFGDGMLITPTGLPYDDLKPGNIVYVGQQGEVAGKKKKPSSEWRFHLAAYAARPDCGGVVHTHSMHATVLACAHRSIPAFHYMVAVAGGNDIPLVPYSIFGSQRLADDVGQALEARDACLMANHGAIAIGDTLECALELAFEIETIAEQYLKVLGLGPAHFLLKSEMNEVLEKFKSYGRKA